MFLVMNRIHFLLLSLVLIIPSITWALPECPSTGYFQNCFGPYTFKNGNKYVGEWKNDKQHGQGTFTWTDGHKYVGEYKDGKMHGQGTFTWADGRKEVGAYKDDKKSGYVTIYNADGSIYQEGIFKDGVFQYAQKKESNGSSALPDCKPNARIWTNCVGTHTWDSGDKYSGEWKDDKRHGQGTYTFADGDKYVGALENGNFNGQGTYTFPDGRKDVGEFKNGLLNGYAIQYNADGTIFKEGIFKDHVFQYAQKKESNGASGKSLFDKFDVEEEMTCMTWNGGTEQVSKKGDFIKAGGTRYRILESDTPNRRYIYDGIGDYKGMADFKKKFFVVNINGNLRYQCF